MGEWGSRRLLRAALGGLLAVSCTGVLGGCSAETAPDMMDSAADSAQDAIQETASFDFNATVEPTVLVDNDQLRISVLGLTFSNDQACFEIEVENRTALEISARTNTLGYAANSINEYMIPDGWTIVDVPAGQTVADEVVFNVSGLKIYGITEIAEVGFGFDVSNEEYDDVFRGYFVVPTSASSQHEFDQDAYRRALESAALQTQLGFSLASFSSDVLFEQSGVSLVSEALLTNSGGEKALNLEFVNATDGELMVSVRDVAIDGSTVYEGAWNGVTLAPGKRGFVDLNLTRLIDQADDPSAFDLEGLESCGMAVSVRDANGNTIVDATNVEVSLR